MAPRKSAGSKKPESQNPSVPQTFTSESAPLRKIPTLFENLYELVVAAATRARQINAGSPTPLDSEENRPLNVALREIAAGKTKYELAERDSEE
jgi:DNA-directed RNA polymerase omega subunit